ncbi:unannotated protein [freshwater metagenome]|uniref:Unannotated protein n=1 Tax=freshwater metagenome TaxID=449393 RepID=A0A6J6CD37_9ZZZZ
MRSPRIGKRSTTSAVALATSFLSFRQSPVNARFSLTVNSAITDLPSDTCIIPDLAKSSGFFPKIASPFQVTTPLSDSFNPDRVLNNVVFPAPFAPIIVVNSPLVTSKETLLTALIAP